MDAEGEEFTLLRKGKAFLSAVMLIIFSIQLLLSIKIATSQTVGTYHPTGYNLLDATTYISGTTGDLVSENGVYMTFRSYASVTSPQTLYAHQETTTVSGVTYYLLKTSSVDTARTTLRADAGTATGRKLMGKFVYPLTGVSSIPASVWVIYYRARKGNVQVEAHADVDILIRTSSGTIRTTIATDVANSSPLTTSWSTLSGTYSWAAYTVVNQTDYLEIDYYIEITVIQSDFVYLRIDDNTLALADQTRAANVILPSEFITELEFTGTSNTYNWAQLVWTVDSAWTTGNVSVTLQLYNYTLGAYPTTGNGYISYVSNATANKDETKNQTITVNPNHFRNATGYWKVKVKGVKTTDTPFDLKVDLVKYAPTFMAPPDVAIVNVTSSQTNVYLGEIVWINVTVKNEGETTETFNVTLYYDNTKIGKQLVSSLAPSATTTLTFNWNNSGVSPATYTIKAMADVIPGETDTADNTYVDGTVKVNMQTSSQPFDWLTAILYTLPIIFCLLFLLILKLKRKKTTVSPKPIQPPEGSLVKPKPKRSDIVKKTDTFSETFGMTHRHMIGKKMLLEIDPTSDYHKALLNFVSEAKNNGEQLFIFTNLNSTLHSALSGAENVKFFLLTSKTSSPQQINEKETLLPARDLSVLLNASVEVLKARKEKTINMLFDNLSDIILRCGFEKTYSFMRFLLEAISSPKTTALFVFNPTAHDPMISSSIRGLFQIQLAYTKSGPKVETL